MIPLTLKPLTTPSRGPATAPPRAVLASRKNPRRRSNPGSETTPWTTSNSRSSSSSSERSRVILKNKMRNNNSSSNTMMGKVRDSQVLKGNPRDDRHSRNTNYRQRSLGWRGLVARTQS